MIDYEVFQLIMFVVVGVVAIAAVGIGALWLAMAKS